MGDASVWEQAGKLRRGRRSTGAQFSLRLDEQQIGALRRIARERGMTFSEVVRDAIAATTARVVAQG